MIAVSQSLASAYPEVAALWHPGNELSAAEVTAGTNLFYLWRCSHGHEWKQSVKQQVKVVHGCLVCAGRTLVPGVNDLATTHPNLAVEWHLTKNNGLLPTQVTARKGRVWWQCAQCSGEWLTPVSERVAGGGRCYHCRTPKDIPADSQVLVKFPQFATEWAYDLNKEVKPETVSYSAHTPVWWRCLQGHEWEASPNSRANSGRGATGCPTCSGRKILPGFNDLATLHPDVAAIWHPTKNAPLTPSMMAPHASTKVWLQPACGHDWEVNISDVTRSDERRSNCGVCSSDIIVAGVNDLASFAPEVAKEWHPEKNKPLLPEEVSRYSAVTAQWVCNQGHEWSATVANRTFRQSGCPSCWASRFASRAERAIGDYVEALDVGLVERNIFRLTGTEVDIYVPSKNIAIEFNGLYWHSGDRKRKTAHYDKWLACKKKGIQLIQVWEDEWIRNPEQVKRMLAHKLGVQLPGERRVMARKTSVKHVKKADAEVFLGHHHVQGYASGSCYLGLVNSETDDLVALLVLRNEAKSKGKILNIIRYATSATVPGGFTKLLKYAERTLQPDSFITFSDHCVSDGGLYRNNGFVADKELPPDYMYVVRGERKHKFGYRLAKFRNDPTLKWEEGLPESKLAALNGLDRIWDAGKTRWVIHYTKQGKEQEESLK